LAPNVVEGPAVSERKQTISRVTKAAALQAENMSTKPGCVISTAWDGTA